MDYGSGMPLIGIMTHLNVSYAMASNTGESQIGMNTTMGVLENGQVLYGSYCKFIESIVRTQVPNFPDFECGY